MKLFSISTMISGRMETTLHMTPEDVRQTLERIFSNIGLDGDTDALDFMNNLDQYSENSYENTEEDTFIIITPHLME